MTWLEEAARVGDGEGLEALGVNPGRDEDRTSADRDGTDGAVVPPVFDRSVLEELAGMIDDEELESYLALLEATVRPRVASLEHHLAAGDTRGMLATAHALAGGAACYGLAGLSAVARRIETGARNRQLEAAGCAVAEASALVEASLAAVWQWRRQSRPGATGLITEAVVTP